MIPIIIYLKPNISTLFIATATYTVRTPVLLNKHLISQNPLQAKKASNAAMVITAINRRRDKSISSNNSSRIADSSVLTF